MQLDDMIIVSVDDHVVEPPDMFERHLPAKYADIAPQARSARTTAPTSGTSRTSRSRTSGSTPWPVARRRSTGSTRRPSRRSAPVATTSTKRVLDMNANGTARLAELPEPPRLRGPALRARSRTRTPRSSSTQAYNDWHIDEWCGYAPGALHPARDPDDLGPRGARRRGAPRREEGLPRDHVPGEPRAARPPEPALGPLGPVLAGVLGRGDDRLHAHRVVGQARDDRGRRADRRDDRAAADEHRAVRGRPHPLARVPEVPGRHRRALRGRHRLDPLLPRAARPLVPHAQGVDRRRLRHEDAERGVHGARDALLHQRRRRREARARHRRRPHHASRSTTRTPTRTGRPRRSG